MNTPMDTTPPFDPNWEPFDPYWEHCVCDAVALAEQEQAEQET